MKQATGKSLEFIQAADDGDIKGLKALWRDHKDEIDLNARDEHYEWAALHGSIGLSSQYSVNTVVDFLLEIGCNPDAKTGNEQNASCLIIAAQEGHNYVLERLIESLKQKYKNDPEKYEEALTFVGGTFKETAQEAAQRGNNNECAEILKKAIENVLPPVVPSGHVELIQVPTKEIFIAGGGLAGTMSAVWLLKLLRENIEQGHTPDHKTKITLIEKKNKQLGGGLAYSFETANDEHVVNLQATRMSLYPNDDDHYKRWLNEKYPEIARNKLNASPRRGFQEYLLTQLNNAIMTSPFTELEVLEKEAHHLDVITKTMYFSDGTERKGDSIILATGHTTALRPDFITDEVVDHERFLASQYGEKARHFMDNIEPNASVFIIGTSMSMEDVVVSLKNRGHEGDIVTMSRHAHMHSVYDEHIFIGNAVDVPPPDFLDADNIDDLKIKMRTQFNQASRLFTDEQILRSWEAYAPELIDNLRDKDVSYKEIAALLKDHKSLIDTKRVSVSYAIGNVIERAIAEGQVNVWKGNIRKIDTARKGRGLNVRYDMTTNDKRSFTNNRVFDYVISSLGQEMDYKKVISPLWNGLMEDGNIQPHWTNIGINVTDKGQIIDATGRPVPGIFAVGPMRAGHENARGHLGPPAFSVPVLKTQIPETMKHVLKL